MSRAFSRREFLCHSLPLAAVAGTVPSFLARTVLAAPLAQGRTSIPGIPDQHILVVVQLSGGNDGLNTLVPYNDDAYYAARPTLGIPSGQVVPLDARVGLHPGLAPLRPLLDEGEVALVQGVGYPNPNRSHFRSMEIWHTASGAETRWAHGWIGRYFDSTCAGEDPIPATAAVAVGREAPQALRTPDGGTAGVVLDDPQSYAWQPAGRSTTQDRRQKSLMQATIEGFSRDTGIPHIDYLQRTAMDVSLSADRIAAADKKYRSRTAYPGTGFADQLRLVAKLITGGLDTRVFYVSLGGFDTHANQPDVHQRLLRTLAEGIAAFRQDLAEHGEWERVLMMGFSEFGRRVAQNDSRGTDHGAAGPMFLFGTSVHGGAIGEHPSLTDLYHGDLKYGIDFRSVYATVLDQWLGLPHQQVLGQSFDPAPILRT
jgi:uncharacterized protein (DUF1501 family)